MTETVMQNTRWIQTYVHLRQNTFTHECKLVKYASYQHDTNWTKNVFDLAKRTDLCVCVNSGMDNDSNYNVARCNENIWKNAHCHFRV